MQVYLMRHAHYQEFDPKHSLSEEGTLQAKNAAKALLKKRLSFDLILASPKERTKETAEIIAEALSLRDRLKIREELRPSGPFEGVIALLLSLTDKNSLLIVGHMPNLQELSSYLLKSHEKLTFTNAGLTAIAIEDIEHQNGEMLFHMTNQQLQKEMHEK